MANGLSQARPVCLDSTASIAYFTPNRPAGSLVAGIIEYHRFQIVVSSVTLAEVVARPAKQRDGRRINEVQSTLLDLSGLRLVVFDQPLAIETAFVRARTGPKLPDAAIVAPARLAGASALLGTDR